MIGKSKKILITEKWVDTYIEMNGHPPTYDEIGKHFELGKCATYSRCAKFRHKMNQHSKKPIIISQDRIEKIIMNKCSSLAEYYGSNAFIIKNSDIILIASKIAKLING